MRWQGKLDGYMYIHIYVYTHTYIHTYRYFGTFREFKEARRVRWQGKLDGYMDTIAADLRDDVVRDIQQLVQGTGLQLS